MKNEIKDINEVIIRFLDGTATGEEKVFLFNWLKQSEKNRNEFSEVRDLWLLGNTIATDDLETEIALERFKNRIQSTESGLRKNRFVFRKHFVPFLRVAAVFLMLIPIVYWNILKRLVHQPVKSVCPVKPILRYGGMRSFLSVCKPER